MSTGIYSTGQFTQDHAKKSFKSAIARLMPNGQAPLFAMTSLLQDEVALQTEHGFFSKTMLFPQITTSAAHVAGDIILNVTSVSNIMPGMIMRNDTTGENIIINSIVSGTSVAVTRGLGSVAAGSIGSGTSLYQVGNAFEESSIRPQSLIINPVRITNLTQIFRNTWAISESARATAMIAGDTNIAESRQDCMAFHAADIEKALIFGQKSQGTRNGQPFRTMDGLISIISNLSYYPSYYSAVNSNVAGGTTNWTQLEGFLDPVFNQTTDPKAGNTRTAFVGGAAKRVLNNIVRLNTTTMISDMKTNVYGLQFSTLRTTRGEFNLVEHPLLNTNPTWAKMMVVVDTSSFNIAYLGNRKTQNRDFNAEGGDGDAVDNGIDATGGTLTTECTTVIKNPPANAIVYNLTAAAVG